MPSQRAPRAPPAPPPQREWPRGPDNELQHAAFNGLTDRLITLIASRRFDVNLGNLEGFTPLICAARKGHLGIVRILLNKGANQAIANCDGFNPLHVSSQHGHIEVAKVLVDAGANLQAMTKLGSTPLHQAAENGHPSVIKMLTEAGADVDTRRYDPMITGGWGGTPLQLAASNGHASATRELLKAKADALLATSWIAGKDGDIPLELAAYGGHSGVARELIQQRGIKGCGGSTGGVEALGLAAHGRHMEIMAMLTTAGVVDTGDALARAASRGVEAPVAFLLKHQGLKAPGGLIHYVNARRMRDSRKRPLFCSVVGCSPRVVRMLIDAGADATVSYSLLDMQKGAEEVWRMTPLALAEQYLSEKKTLGGKNLTQNDVHLSDKEALGGKNLTEKELQGLKAIRRLLMQVDAVHAVSWLWPAAQPTFGRAAECTGRSNTATEPVGTTPLRRMLPLMRRRAARRGLALPSLSRFSKKP